MSVAEPLNYATRYTSGVCPICNERPIASKKQLYGHPVCKKCLYRFANRRQFAYIVDSLLVTAVAIGITMAVEGLLNQIQADSVTVFLVELGIALPINLLFIMRDGFNGQSPGKRLTGVQVVDDSTGRPISFLQSFKRNWFFLLGIVPFAGGVITLTLVVIIIIQMNKGPRLGDQAARTRVIWKKYSTRRSSAASACSAAHAGTTSPATCRACVRSAVNRPNSRRWPPFQLKNKLLRTTSAHDG